MTKPLTDQLRAYFDDVDRQQGAVDIDALRRSVEERVTMIELSSDKAVPPSGPTSTRRWPILAAAAAVVLVLVGAFVVSGGDDTQNDSPANLPATVPSTTTVDTSPTELMVRPLDPPIDCRLEQCPWSPELTGQALDPPFACTGSPRTPLCPSLAVSPDGTLVAFDATAETLTWYEDEPRVVRLTDELPSIVEATLIAIGPHDIAYISVGTRPSAFVAVGPSGAEITRVDTPNGAPALYPTATGLGATFYPGYPDQLHAELWVPWVDLDGNPITDTRPYPTATVTDAGIEVRLGEREWLLAGEEGSDDSALVTFPRSDGGVVMVPFVYGQTTPRTKVVKLSTDGTIEHYFVNTWLRTVLPDGSLIVEHNLQLVRLTPPA